MRAVSRGHSACRPGLTLTDARAAYGCDMNANADLLFDEDVTSIEPTRTDIIASLAS
jgi:hypothetical protein